MDIQISKIIIVYHQFLLCISQIFHISGAEHNSISGLYRGLLCDSELEHLSVSGPGLHSAGGLTLSSENRELVDKRTARVLI